MTIEKKWNAKWEKISLCSRTADSDGIVASFLQLFLSDRTSSIVSEHAEAAHYIASQSKINHAGYRRIEVIEIVQILK